MKRFLQIAIPLLLILAALITVRSHAQNAPLPSTLNTTGYGPYETALIQPRQSPWTITLNYAPLNNSASVSILNQSHYFVDYKLVAATAPGQLVYQGQGTDPMYVEAYAGNWTISLSY